MSVLKEGLCAGLDETGRGSIAGPIFVGLAVCHEKIQHHLKDLGVKDSKKLSEGRRDTVYRSLSESLTSPLLYFATASREAWYIDCYGIEKSTQDCVKELLFGLKQRFNIKDEDTHSPINVIYFDQGLKPRTSKVFQDYNIRSVVVEEPRADSKYPIVSAASVIAKVERDKIMVQKSFQYPEYEFEKNKGYGTKSHYQTIQQIGFVENFHRQSYLK